MTTNVPTINPVEIIAAKLIGKKNTELEKKCNRMALRRHILVDLMIFGELQMSEDTGVPENVFQISPPLFRVWSIFGGYGQLLVSSTFLVKLLLWFGQPKIIFSRHEVNLSTSDGDPS